MNSHFIITSPGKTASFWLANALDMHPDILCSHGTLSIPASELYISGWNSHEMIGSFWKQQKISNALKEFLNKSIGDSIEKEHDIFYKRSLDHFFSIQENMGKAKYYGNVHGFTFYALLGKIKKTTYIYKIANMQRHPVTLIESAFGKSDTFNHLKTLEAYNHIFDPVVSKYNLDMTPYNLFFIYHCYRLEEYFISYQTPQLYHIPMERITKNKDYFCSILKMLCSEEIEISDEYINSVFTMGRVNIHGNTKKDPITIYNNWDIWQKELFQEMLFSYQDIFPKAKELGYDLEYFTNPIK